METQNNKSTIKRIGGYLHKVTPVIDGTGKVVQFVVSPLMVELKMRDIMQIIIGASILAVPVAFTEETWNLGLNLPFINVLLISLLSILFIGIFVFFNFYKDNIKGHIIEFIKRTAAIYFFSLVVVGLLLTLIDKCPWGTNNILAIKRILIVAFPSSMSATLSDSIK